MNKTVLITGCSSGFGKLAAKKFQQEGWNVVATMRSPEKETELNQLENVLVTKLDVTDGDSVKQAVKTGVLKFGRIDVLVNNAGYGGYGLFEQNSEENIRAMYETNVFGLMAVTREVLPVMREQKEGVIVNLSSLVGIFAGPTVSVYSSTKFAVKGFSEGLALELKPLNIKVKTICPGGFDTNFQASCDVNFQNGDDELKAHGQLLAKHMEMASQNSTKEGAPAPNSQDVSDLIYKCSTEETPIHNVVGADAQMIAQMRDSMSDHEFLTQMEGMLLPH